MAKKLRWFNWKLMLSNTLVMPIPLVELMAFILFAAFPVPSTVWDTPPSETLVSTGCMLGADKLPETLRSPETSRLVASVDVVSVKVSLGVPSTENAAWSVQIRMR